MDLSPTISDFMRLITLADYNTRVVLLGSAILGLSAGAMGTFMMLRRRAMISDVVSHAALPGIVAAFMLTAGWPGGGKHLPILLLGALISGFAGMACVQLIKSRSHIKEDAALGIVLSVFFGLGVVLLGFAQRMKTGSAAGLESFIYGKTASMLASDAWLMAASALVIGLVCLVFFKEFKLLCFDQEFAQSQGWPVHRLDALLTGMVVVVTVIGLQAVGLILMIALLIIPPAAARFWTDRLGVLVTLSALFGATSAVIGASLSALYPGLPAGAMIVLVCAATFIISMLAGKRRGIVIKIFHQHRLSSRIARHNLLRALYENLEEKQPDIANASVVSHTLINVQELTEAGRWSTAKLDDLLNQAASDGEIEFQASPLIRVTSKGLEHARRVVRNHRLWEWYLISHADVDSAHVDRDADEIEHILGVGLVNDLEKSLAAHLKPHAVPASPHPIKTGKPS